VSEAYQTIKTDVLVVGAGGAACRAALEASWSGAKVILAVKGTIGAIGVRGAGSTAGGVSDRGGVQFPGMPGLQDFDPKGAKPHSPAKDFANIIQLGLGMTDRKLARIMADRAYGIMTPLAEWSGEIFPRQWGMKSHGIPIIFGLTRMVRRSGVEIMENTMITHLLKEEGQIAGAVGIDELNGEVVVIKAGAVFLGTGGKAGLFKHTTAGPECTGDGHAMAYQAGAQLMNLEFKQVFPGTIYPTINHFSAWWFVPHVRIYNAHGKEYIEKYLPKGITLDMVYSQRRKHGPFSVRDSASRYFDVATMKETKAGKANKHNALYIDLTDPRVKDPLAKARGEYFYYRGIRYLEEPIEFNICFHCSNGGVRIDENAESVSVRGLYAAGEVAAGMHGANRMAGHMLSASQIFGAIGGKHAASRTAGLRQPDLREATIKEAVDEIAMFRAMKGGENPTAVTKDLQELAWNTMLVDVNEALLDQAITDIADMRENRMTRLDVGSPTDLIRAIELRNLLTVGDLLARATRMRKESRGDMYREDYPERDDVKWNCVIVIDRGTDAPRLLTEVIDPEWEDREATLEGFRWG
jgi:succinate dehydrogenase/fumarate reductase flavoprotein subunit